MSRPFQLPRLSEILRCIPGQEYGVHAGYDSAGRELVYIGCEYMTMHKDVLDHIEQEWERIFNLEDTRGTT